MFSRFDCYAISDILYALLQPMLLAAMFYPSLLFHFSAVSILYAIVQPILFSMSVFRRFFYAVPGSCFYAAILFFQFPESFILSHRQWSMCI